jgi:nicotinate-nucleotide adenylyltransferase
LKLGILGGTFDPIHYGHLRTAEEVGEGLGLDKVYLIPSASPPHKTQIPVTPFHHRLAMTTLGIGASSLLEAQDLEGKRPGLSFSIETLRSLQGVMDPKPELFFIVGADAFVDIRTWKEYEKLFDYADFVIVERPGYATKDPEGLLGTLGLRFRPGSGKGTFVLPSGHRLMFLEATLMDISSTRIRNLVASRKSIRYLLPDSVLDYIVEHRLYCRRDGIFG